MGICQQQYFTTKVTSRQVASSPLLYHSLVVLSLLIVLVDLVSKIITPVPEVRKQENHMMSVPFLFSKGEFFPHDFLQSISQPLNFMVVFVDAVGTTMVLIICLVWAVAFANRCRLNAL